MRVHCAALRGSLAAGVLACALLSSETAQASAPIWSTSAPSIPLAGPRLSSPVGGVSCASSTFCIAVGSQVERSAAHDGTSEPFIDRWDGTTWSEDVVSLPHAASGYLTAVSCPVVGACVAVGVRGSSSAQSPFVETLSGGTWTLGALAVPSGINRFNFGTEGISCPEMTHCVVAGTVSASASYSHNDRGVVYTQSSAGWSVQLLANLPGALGTDITAVSCAAATSCAAAALSWSVDDAGGDVSRAELARWSGATWSATTAVLPSGETWDQSYLQSVSCAPGGTCVALGESLAYATGDEPVFADTLVGASWTSVTIPVPSGEAALMPYALSCPSAGSCVATASVRTSSDVSSTDHVTFSSGHWASDVGAPTSTPQAELAISCSSTSFCVSTGVRRADLVTGYTVEPFAASGPTSWLARDLPVSGGPTLAWGAGVSCVASTCRVVGRFIDAAGIERPLVASVAGPNWAPQTVAIPGDASARLRAVSCWTVSQCVAVGDESSAVAGQRRFIVASSKGSSWTTQIVSPPYVGAALTSISCATATSCTAVGESTTHLYRASFRGGSWSLSEVALPVRDHLVVAPSVVCVHATDCVVAFSASTPSGVRPFLDVETSGRWVLQDAPVAPGDTQVIRALACPTLGHCILVGDRSGSNAVVVDDVVGLRWTIREFTLPSTHRAASLGTISCTSPSACQALGTYVLGTSTYTFAERLVTGSWSATGLAPVTLATDRAHAGLSNVAASVSCTSQGLCVGVGTASSFWTSVPTVSRWP